MCFSAFVVKCVESRQTNVGDFFLRESNCRVRRQSVARRTNGRSGRAARQRQRPSYSQYRYGFRPTLSLRISLAMRHGEGFPFHPTLMCLIRQRQPQRSVRTLEAGLPMSALGQKRTSRSEITMSALPSQTDIAEYDWDVRFVPEPDEVQCTTNPRVKSDEAQSP